MSWFAVDGAGMVEVTLGCVGVLLCVLRGVAERGSELVGFESTQFEPCIVDVRESTPAVIALMFFGLDHGALV